MRHRYTPDSSTLKTPRKMPPMLAVVFRTALKTFHFASRATWLTAPASIRANVIFALGFLCDFRRALSTNQREHCLRMRWARVCIAPIDAGNDRYFDQIDRARIAIARAIRKRQRIASRERKFGTAARFARTASLCVFVDRPVDLYESLRAESESAGR